MRKNKKGETKNETSGGMRVVVFGAGVLCQLRAQADFKLAGREVQMHSFASEGVIYTNNNNYLTMNTTDGASFTDMGVVLSSRITSRLRVGAQVYDRDIGHLQQWHPNLDWASVDYSFSDAFGVRGGKVKTALGLYNQTQDLEFGQTWALMPQAVYPLDLRSRTLTHTGLDLYGRIRLSRAGGLMYTVYAGKRPNDTRDGIYYAWGFLGYPNTSFSGKMAGTDLRWKPPIRNLMVGGSYAAINDKYHFIDLSSGPVPVAGTLDSTHMWIASAYGEYSRGRWRFDSEYRRNMAIYWQVDPSPGQTETWWYSDKGWFASVVYQAKPRLEIGTYHDRYYFDHWSLPDPSTHYIRDQALTLHYTFTHYMGAKVEGHVMDGTGDMWSSHEFYLANNPGGLLPRTKMLVARIGFSF
jgi:hypothetical protein